MPSQDLLQTFQMSAKKKKKFHNKHMIALYHTSKITMTNIGKENKYIKKQSGFPKVIYPSQSREPCIL